MFFAGIDHNSEFAMFVLTHSDAGQYCHVSDDVMQLVLLNTHFACRYTPYGSIIMKNVKLDDSTRTIRVRIADTAVIYRGCYGNTAELAILQLKRCCSNKSVNLLK